MQAGRLAARAIKANGVDTLFTLSGGHVMPIYEGCRAEGVRVLDVRHEQAAAHAAEAWGRVNRACGVALVTSGPGVTGVVTAVANCRVAQTPLVVLGGARPLVQAEQGALQELDQLSIFKPITKWAAVCTHPERVPDLISTAFRHALAQPRGPVYLELPMDILFADAEEERPAAPSRSAARAFGDPKEMTKAADLLTNAERPAVIAGSGIWWDGAWKQLAAFAENGRLPVYLNGSGRGALPPDHELFFQHSRSSAVAARRRRLRRSGRRSTSGSSSGASTRTRSSSTSMPTRPSSAATARRTRASSATARPCSGSWPTASRTAAANDEWLERLRAAEAAWWDENRALVESESAPLNHYRLGSELDRVLDPATIVIGDGGDVVAACSRVLRVHRPGHWLDPGPFGCLGVGPPYALGVKAARPDAQVVVIAGDGAFGLNGFEFETLTRFGLPVVFVIGNDAAWGEIRIPQRGIYGEDAEVATLLAPSRYDRLTEAFGGHGEHVERPDELAPALERALASGEPAIVNVMLDPLGMAGHAYRGM